MMTAPYEPTATELELLALIDMPATNTEAMAAVHMLDIPTVRQKVAAFMSPGAIRFDDLLDSWPCSTGERTVIRAAAALWDCANPVNLGDLIADLDDVIFARLLDAIRLRRPSPRPVSR